MSELPPGWALATLGEVCSSAEQVQPVPTESFQYIDISSIDREKKAIHEPASILGAMAPSRARRLVRRGDILVSMTRPVLNAVALVPTNLDGQIASTGFEVLRPKEVEPRWILFLVRANDFVTQMAKLVRGALYPAIKSADVRGFVVPIPPFNEQRRIADRLDALLAQVDACRERFDRVSAIVKRFRQAVLAAATSGRLTEDWRDAMGQSFAWQSLRLADIAEIQGGVTKDSNKQIADAEELPYLRVANVQRGFLDLAEVKTIRIPSGRVASLLLQPGDILFNEGGDIDKLGRGWIWEGQIERCSFQNHVFRARLFDKSNQPKYVSWWGNFRGLAYFLSSGKQTTNLASINKSMLSSLPISLPSPEEQEEIVRRVELLFNYADRLEQRIQATRARVERLTPALLAKAFRGELVPQDPNDESAEILLERLRQSASDGETKRRPGRKSASR